MSKLLQDADLWPDFNESELQLEFESDHREGTTADDAPRDSDPSRRAA